MFYGAEILDNIAKVFKTEITICGKVKSLALATELYGQDWNDRIARLRRKERLQIIFPELLFLSYSKNIPQIVNANICNIAYTDFILSSKEKIFRFVTEELRTDIQKMM